MCVKMYFNYLNGPGVNLPVEYRPRRGSCSLREQEETLASYGERKMET